MRMERIFYISNNVSFPVVALFFIMRVPMTLYINASRLYIQGPPPPTASKESMILKHQDLAVPLSSFSPLYLLASGHFFTSLLCCDCWIVCHFFFYISFYCQTSVDDQEVVLPWVIIVVAHESSSCLFFFSVSIKDHWVAPRATLWWWATFWCVWFCSSHHILPPFFTYKT